MDKPRKIIFPDGREEVVRFVHLQRKGAGGFAIPGHLPGAYNHYVLVTDNATYEVKHYKDLESIVRDGPLVSDSELPAIILLKENKTCEFPDLPANENPDNERWRFVGCHPHTAVEETRLQREALERDKTVSQVPDHKPDAQVVSPRAREGAAEPSAQYVFHRSGDFWEIVFEGHKLPPVRHLEGMTYLCKLLSRPGHDFSARDLYELENPPPPEALCRNNREGAEIAANYGTGGKTQRLLEGQTPDKLRRAKAALEQKLEDTDLSSTQREHIEEQIEAIDKVLSASRVATATGGATFEPKENKQPRQAVSKTIDKAVDVLTEQYGNLGKHLGSAVLKGNTFFYTGGLTWET